MYIAAYKHGQMYLLNGAALGLAFPAIHTHNTYIYVFGRRGFRAKILALRLRFDSW